MIVAAIRMALHFDQGRSLKEKRRLLKSIIEKTRHRYNVSVSEIADQDLWQKATVGISYVSLTRYQSEKQAFSIKKFIETLDKAIISQYNYEMIKSDV
jgi:uncharacterized protein YlxP (DUF503 family)